MGWALLYHPPFVLPGAGPTYRPYTYIIKRELHHLTIIICYAYLGGLFAPRPHPSLIP